jgi:hypothetical protein
VAGDFSPMTIEADHGAARAVPPALLLAMAVGLGSMDTPVPSVIEWEWLNWKFPRPVHAGDTIYARWTLTQKRPPAAGATSSIVVWRVDLHTADGAMCAEGEVGAMVRRQVTGVAPRPRMPEAKAVATALPAAPAGSPPARGRRRRRRPGGNGSAPETPAVATPPAPAAAKPADRATAAPRRRRRRRPASASSGAREGDGDGGASAAGPAPEPSAAQPAPAPAPAGHPKSPLSRVIGRLRRA